MVTLAPDCPFEATTKGSKSTVIRKYKAYESVIPRFRIPEATMFLDSVVKVNPNNYEQILHVMNQVVGPPGDPNMKQTILMTVVDGAIHIELQSKYQNCCPVMAGGHTDFCWMRCIRRILMLFFGKQYSRFYITWSGVESCF